MTTIPKLETIRDIHTRNAGDTIVTVGIADANGDSLHYGVFLYSQKHAEDLSTLIDLIERDAGATFISVAYNKARMVLVFRKT